MSEPFTGPGDTDLDALVQLEEHWLSKSRTVGLTVGPTVGLNAAQEPTARPLSSFEDVLRGGYRLEERTLAHRSDAPNAGAPAGGEGPFVVPAFSEGLAACVQDPDEWATFQHRAHPIWEFDLPTWEALAGWDASELALRWGQSAGRGLVQKLSVLRPRASASDAQAHLEAMWRAAGVSGMPSGSAELHAWLRSRPRPFGWWQEMTELPGTPLQLYLQFPLDTQAPHGNQTPWKQLGDRVLRTLRQLEQTGSIIARTAALSYLLDLAADQPIYEVEGVQRSLREELPARIAQAFPADPEESERRAEAFETAVLELSARLSLPDLQPGRVLRAWGLARWLARCTSRSPIYGGDLEKLTLQLKAFLPREVPEVEGELED